ncbi:MAG: AmmeMemoRadiSam system protein A [Lachnospiraceae bacterium]|nr:AmmeMemoRadiSam system protein A [Lachnospiraceae bacterium]
MPIIGAIMVPHPPIILPEVGRGEEKKIQATIDAYRQAAAEMAALKPEVLLIASPHSILYGDYFHISPGTGTTGTMRQFRADQVRFSVRYDEELVKKIEAEAETADVPAGTLGEREPALDHGTMIPLYFLERESALAGVPIVRISLSGLPLVDHYRFGQCIAKAVEALDRRAVFVGSGDLSHKCRAEGPYGFAPEGPDYDRRIMEVMGRADFGRLFDFDEHFLDKAAECGHRSFVIMAGALDGRALDCRRLSHEDTFGVGYGVCTYRVTGTDEDRRFLEAHKKEKALRMEKRREAEDAWVRLARLSLETYIKTGRELTRGEYPADLPAELTDRRAGAFVSLHRNGQLRGCIGTIGPTTDSVADEIVQNAVSAAVRDPRFFPVQMPELADLEVSVDVLGETEPIDSVDELDVKRYGVIVSCGSRRGLLLPNLDGVDTIEEQVRIAREKGGIREGEKGIRYERFEVIRHNPNT